MLRAKRNKSNLFTLAAGTGVSADGTLLVCANLPTRAGREARARPAWRGAARGGRGRLGRKGSDLIEPLSGKYARYSKMSSPSFRIIGIIFYFRYYRGAWTYSKFSVKLLLGLLCNQKNSNTFDCACTEPRVFVCFLPYASLVSSHSVSYLITLNTTQES